MKIIAEGFLWILATVAVCFFVISLMCGCSAPDPGYVGPIVVKDAGPDAVACYPQESGAKIACQEVCRINLRSHNALDSGVFDYNACLSGCDCVSPCVPLMWVDTQFLPCDVACADAGDRQTCINSCSCVAN